MAKLQLLVKLRLMTIFLHLDNLSRASATVGFGKIVVAGVDCSVVLESLSDCRPIVLGSFSDLSLIHI